MIYIFAKITKNNNLSKKLVKKSVCHFFKRLLSRTRVTNNVFRRLANAGSGSGFLYYHDATKPIGNPSLILLSSGNKFQSVSGHICEYYDGADINIYSSDEVCLDDDYYEAKSEYYEDH